VKYSSQCTVTAAKQEGDVDKQNQNLDDLVDRAERLGVVGSPSSTSQLALDILGAAVTRKLVGELALFRFLQDSSPHYALGQITEIQLRNIWHEDPTMRSLIRQRGRIDAVSERQDTHLGQMVISAVFRRGGPGGYEPSILGTVPSTGTAIQLVSDDVLNVLLQPYRDQIYYLGHVYGSKPKLPLWFKHFDQGPDGAGEAYHLGIFGKTGSGKSVLAKMILLAYSRYPRMALLVIDPQGEFSKDMREGKGSRGFALPVGDIARQLGKKPVILTVKNLVLDTWELFTQILYESPFFERLTVPKAENREIACQVLTEKLQKANIKLSELHLRRSFDEAWSLLADERVQKIFYRTDASRARFDHALHEANREEFFKDFWQPVTELFREDRQGARSVNKALSWLIGTGTQSQVAPSRPILVIDLSREQTRGLFWNDQIQSLVIKRLLDQLTQTAEYFYKEKDEQSLNMLVVIDEAHRLAPRELSRDDEAARGVRKVLVDAARTTRKYGLGWLFISQTLSSLDPEIIQQLRIFFFGFGLALGQEFQSLRQLVGSSGTALDLYQLFRDPHSAFDVASRQYSFMTIGPVSPLSFSGSPLFLNVFNTVDSFLSANNLKK
jgi:Helicase HerA, central domain